MKAVTVAITTICFCATASTLSVLASVGAVPNWKAARLLASNPLVPTSTTMEHTDLERELDSPSKTFSRNSPNTSTSSVGSSPSPSSSLATTTTPVETTIPPTAETTSVVPTPTTVESLPVETTLPPLPEVTVPETTVPVTVEVPETPLDSRFLDVTNGERDNPLIWSDALAAYAEIHLSAMLAAGSLFHSNLDVLLTDWTIVGENVGKGPSVEEIHKAYMSSASHASNVAFPAYTHFGSASRVNPLDGLIWTVEMFGR